MIEWRPIPSAPNYESYSAGDIRRARPGRRTIVGKVLRAKAEANGYLRVCLYHDGIKKFATVHRLVCEAFHGSPPTDADCAHWNGVKIDNVPSNLRWCRRAENIADKNRHGTMARGSRQGCAILNENDIPEIRRLIAAGKPYSAVGDAYGVSKDTIVAVIKGRSWNHVA